MQWHRELATFLVHQPKKTHTHTKTERLKPARRNIFGEEIFEFDERKGNANESNAKNNEKHYGRNSRNRYVRIIFAISA